MIRYFRKYTYLRKYFRTKVLPYTYCTWLRAQYTYWRESETNVLEGVGNERTFWYHFSVHVCPRVHTKIRTSPRSPSSGLIAVVISRVDARALGSYARQQSECGAIGKKPKKRVLQQKLLLKIRPLWVISSARARARAPSRARLRAPARATASTPVYERARRVSTR
jgi:hypothetical protein